MSSPPDEPPPPPGSLLRPLIDTRPTREPSRAGFLYLAFIALALLAFLALALSFL